MALRAPAFLLSKLPLALALTFSEPMKPLKLPVVITAFADKSFTFVLKSPPATVLLKKAAKIDKGSAKPHLDKVGSVTLAQLEEIAKTKMKDLNANSVEAAMKIILGSARSCGIEVKG